MNALKNFFSLVASIIAWTEETFLCFLLFSMILLACLQIFLRIFFSSGILWIDPLLRYMVIWAGLFGAAVATKRSKHISIDIISHLLPHQFLPWLHGLLNLFSGAVCSGLTYAAIIFVRDEALYGGSGVLAIPSWCLNLAFPVALGIISCRFLVLAGKEVGQILQHKTTANLQP
jgi:TRAP-type C4-dicarboxylate transport system permease small subunit